MGFFEAVDLVGFEAVEILGFGVVDVLEFMVVVVANVSGGGLDTILGISMFISSAMRARDSLYQFECKMNEERYTPHTVDYWARVPVLRAEEHLFCCLDEGDLLDDQ